MQVFRWFARWWRVLAAGTALAVAVWLGITWVPNWSESLNDTTERLSWVATLATAVCLLALWALRNSTSTEPGGRPAEPVLAGRALHLIPDHLDQLGDRPVAAFATVGDPLQGLPQDVALVGIHADQRQVVTFKRLPQLPGRLLELLGKRLLQFHDPQFMTGAARAFSSASASLRSTIRPAPNPRSSVRTRKRSRSCWENGPSSSSSEAARASRPASCWTGSGPRLTCPSTFRWTSFLSRRAR